MNTGEVMHALAPAVLGVFSHLGSVSNPGFSPHRPNTTRSMAQLYELVNPQLFRVGVGTLVIAYAIRLFINYRNAIAAFNYLPGYRGFLSHRSTLTRLFPPWKYFNGAEIFEYWNKYERTSWIHGDSVVFADH